jgi:uncharacterized protein YozE (UPF0346 family)
LGKNFIFIPMERTAFHSPFGSSDMEENPVFNVVIAYEDFDTGKHAKETYDFLVHNLGHECRFSNQMWKFDVLGVPKLREMAAKDAQTADIIIISCHGAHDLPVDVRAWINSWVQNGTNAIALVTLFANESPLGESQYLRAYIADVANRGQMEWFAQPSNSPTKRLDKILPMQRASKRDDKTFAALASVIERDHSFPRWGINE